jgi:hypothetical protein
VLAGGWIVECLAGGDQEPTASSSGTQRLSGHSPQEGDSRDVRAPVSELGPAALLEVRPELERSEIIERFW